MREGMGECEARSLSASERSERADFLCRIYTRLDVERGSVGGGSLPERLSVGAYAC